MGTLSTATEQIASTDLAAKIIKEIQSPLEKCEAHHQKKLKVILHAIEKEINLAVFKLKLSEVSLQRKILFKLKTEIIARIDMIKMSEERKSYLLHQVAQVQDTDSLVELIQEMNRLQSQQPSIILTLTSEDSSETIDHKIALNRQDFLFIAQTAQGVVMTKQTFNLISGIYLDVLNADTSTHVESVAKRDSILLLNRISKTVTTDDLKGKTLVDSIVAIVGLTDHTASFAKNLVAGHVQKLIILHHSPIDASLKFQKTIVRLVEEVLSLKGDTPLTKNLQNNRELMILDLLELPEIKKFLVATSDLTAVKEADIIFCGNCPTSSFLTDELIKNDAVVISR